MSFGKVFGQPPSTGDGDGSRGDPFSSSEQRLSRTAKGNALPPTNRSHGRPGPDGLTRTPSPPSHPRHPVSSRRGCSPTRRSHSETAAIDIEMTTYNSSGSRQQTSSAPDRQETTGTGTWRTTRRGKNRGAPPLPPLLDRHHDRSSVSHSHRHAVKAANTRVTTTADGHHPHHQQQQQKREKQKERHIDSTSRTTDDLRHAHHQHHLEHDMKERRSAHAAASPAERARRLLVSVIENGYRLQREHPSWVLYVRITKRVRVTVTPISAMEQQKKIDAFVDPDKKEEEEEGQGFEREEEEKNESEPLLFGSPSPKPKVSRDGPSGGDETPGRSATAAGEPFGPLPSSLTLNQHQQEEEQAAAVQYRYEEQTQWYRVVHIQPVYQDSDEPSASSSFAGGRSRSKSKGSPSKLRSSSLQTPAKRQVSRTAGAPSASPTPAPKHQHQRQEKGTEIEIGRNLLGYTMFYADELEAEAEDQKGSLTIHKLSSFEANTDIVHLFLERRQRGTRLIEALMALKADKGDIVRVVLAGDPRGPVARCWELVSFDQLNNDVHFFESNEDGDADSAFTFGIGSCMWSEPRTWCKCLKLNPAVDYSSSDDDDDDICGCHSTQSGDGSSSGGVSDSDSAVEEEANEDEEEGKENKAHVAAATPEVEATAHHVDGDGGGLSKSNDGNEGGHGDDEPRPLCAHRHRSHKRTAAGIARGRYSARRKKRECTISADTAVASISYVRLASFSSWGWYGMCFIHLSALGLNLVSLVLLVESPPAFVAGAPTTPSPLLANTSHPPIKVEKVALLAGNPNGSGDGVFIQIMVTCLMGLLSAGINFATFIGINTLGSAGMETLKATTSMVTQGTVVSTGAHFSNVMLAVGNLNDANHIDPAQYASNPRPQLVALWATLTATFFLQLLSAVGHAGLLEAIGDKRTRESEIANALNEVAAKKSAPLPGSDEGDGGT